MSELRRDPVSGRWVIVAPERADRPLPRPSPGGSHPRGPCPFCPGAEDATPPEVLAVRAPGAAPNGPDWRVRVFPNRYPALAPGRPGRGSPRGLFRTLPGVGAHEVVVESPAHESSWTGLSEEDLALAMGVFRERLGFHSRRQDLRYALLFKNVGIEAGASLEHNHCQIVGTPVLPEVIEQEARVIRRQWRGRRQCVFCEMIRRETAEGKRMVLATDSFVAFCPFASRFPLETWVVPAAHSPDFASLPDGLTGPLASVLRDLLARLEREMGSPRYNVLFHTAPFHRKGDDSYHWHIEVLPRLGQAAGFEWGSGLHVNPVPPEEAAARLRGDGDKGARGD